MEPSRDDKRRKRPRRPKLKTKGAYDTYVPHSKKINRQDDITDKSSDAYQRIAWYQLKTSIYVLINKVNPINIGTVKKELLKQNILRGKGLFCKFITQAQIASTNDTRVYATLVAVINLVFPEIGKLLLARCIKRFKIAYYSIDQQYKSLASVIFIAHLINHGVADEMLAIELLTLLLGSLQTTVSIEGAIVILEICGKKVSEVHKKRMNAILDIMHSISLDEQFPEKIKNKIKSILKSHANGFKVKQLDLIPIDDCQITHFVSLDSDIDTCDAIDNYHYDQNYEVNENNYKFLTIESLQESETEEENGFEFTNYHRKHKNNLKVKLIKQTNNSEIYPKNMTSTRKICLRNSINIIVDFSLNKNENGHEFMKYGQEMELYLTFLDRCYKQTGQKDNFGLIAQGIFQKINSFAEPSKTVYVYSYVTSHGFDVQKLRIITNFLFYLLFSNSISLKELLIMRHTDDEETASNRNYTEILSREIVQHLKCNKLQVRVQDLNKFTDCLKPQPKQLVSIAVIDN